MMNYIDLLLFIVVILSAWAGYQRGFIIGIIELLSWLISLGLGFLYYARLAVLIERWFPKLGIWAVPLAFILAIVLVRIVISLLTNFLLRRIPRETHRHLLNKTLGIIPGLLNGIIWCAIIATLLLVIPLWTKSTTATQQSKIAQVLTTGLEAINQKIEPLFDDVVKRSVNRLVIKPDNEKSVKLPYTVQRPEVRADLEKEMLDMVNEERQKAGLGILKPDPALTLVAREHSRDMFARGYFSHITPDGKDPFYRMKQSNVPFIKAGENLALAQTLSLAHYGLMHSPEHKANILNAGFGRVGIGVLDGGIYGLMITQNFRN